MPLRLRPERIVRSNIRLRKKATRIIVFWDFKHCRFGYVNLTALVVWLFGYVYLTRLDASLAHQNRPGFDQRGS